MSSALRDGFEGGGEGRSEEVCPPVVGSSLAREGGGGVACSSDSSSLSLAFGSSKSKSSSDDESSCGVRPPLDAGCLGGGKLDPSELRAVGWGWGAGVRLPRTMVDNTKGRREGCELLYTGNRLNLPGRNLIFVI
jgi:hypothetical protein